MKCHIIWKQPWIITGYQTVLTLTKALMVHSLFCYIVFYLVNINTNQLDVETGWVLSVRVTPSFLVMASL